MIAKQPVLEEEFPALGPSLPDFPPEWLSTGASLVFTDLFALGLQLLVLGIAVLQGAEVTDTNVQIESTVQEQSIGLPVPFKLFKRM